MELMSVDGGRILATFPGGGFDQQKSAKDILHLAFKIDNKIFVLCI
jgi:hypothetical protein